MADKEKPTETIQVPKELNIKLSPEEECRAKGGKWINGQCQLIQEAPAPEQRTEITQGPQTQRELQELQREQFSIQQVEARKKAEAEAQQREAELDKPLGQIDLTATQEQEQEQVKTMDTGADTDITFRDDGTIDYTRGGETINLTRDEYDVVLGKAGQITDKVKQAQALKSRAELQAQQLAQQVGQFDPTQIEPTGLDYGQALVSSLVQTLPRAITYGLGAAAVTGAGTNPLSIIAGVGTFLGTLSSGMISNMKSQRSNTTTAQQRVLDEGKQTMKDWATLAETDPANKYRYLTEYNKVSAQVDAAYRQMKLDTSRDVTKFETALPNLAEFEAFYAEGGERDTLDVEMRNSLATPAPIDNRILELQERRKQ